MAINTLKLRPLLLHIFFWICFLAIPILLGPNTNSSSPEDVQRHFQWTLFFVVFGLHNIPFFYFNTEFLIPKIYKTRGTLLYLICLLGSIVFMVWYHDQLFDWFFDDVFQGGNRGGGRRGGTSLRIVFQLLFVVAVGISYRFLSDNIQEQESKKEEEKERLKSELSFLRSQISPHFMFNVLNSVVALSRRKPEMVEPVVIKLSELMRYMIYETNDSKVNINKEFIYLESYIELQKLRFGNDISIDFQNDICKIPSSIEPMLLIPFVENAFKHGVGMIENPTIEINLVDTPAQLIFSVRNKKGKQLEEKKDDSSGIGLANVRRRLELLYPETHTLSIHEESDSYQIELIITHV